MWQQLEILWNRKLRSALNSGSGTVQKPPQECMWCDCRGACRGGGMQQVNWGRDVVSHLSKQGQWDNFDETKYSTVFFPSCSLIINFEYFTFGTRFSMSLDPAEKQPISLFIHLWKLMFVCLLSFMRNGKGGPGSAHRGWIDKQAFLFKPALLKVTWMADLRWPPQNIYNALEVKVQNVRLYSNRSWTFQRHIQSFWMCNQVSAFTKITPIFLTLLLELLLIMH